MPEEPLLLIVDLIVLSPIIAGLRDAGLSLIGSVGQALSGAAAWAARVSWALSTRTPAAFAVLCLPRPDSGQQGWLPVLPLLLLVIGVLITAPVFAGLVLADFENSKLRFAPYFRVSTASAPVLPLETLAGLLWALVVVAWGSAATDAAGLLPIGPYHWLPRMARRCLAALFFIMLLLSFVAAILFYDSGQAVVDRRPPLIPDAAAIFNLLFALLLHASVAVTGWSAPLLVWVALLVLVGAVYLFSLLTWVVLAFLTTRLEDITIIVLRLTDLTARLGCLFWNAIAQSPLGEWLHLAPLDEPLGWRWVRHDVGGPFPSTTREPPGLVLEPLAGRGVPRLQA